MKIKFYFQDDGHTYFKKSTFFKNVWKSSFFLLSMLVLMSFNSTINHSYCNQLLQQLKKEIAENLINNKTVTQTQAIEMNLIMALPAPGGIDTDMTLWLKADAGTSTTVDDATVNVWADQSGTGNDANLQTSDPSYQDDAASLLNFNPGVHFDGNDYFRINSQLGWSGAAQSLTVFAVTSKGSYLPIVQQGVNGGTAFFSSSGDGYFVRTISPGGDDPILLSTSVEGNEANGVNGVILSGDKDGTTQVWRLYDNGDFGGMATESDGAESHTYTHMGYSTNHSGGNWANGNMNEVIFYTRQLTDNDGIADNIESNTQDTDGDGDPDFNDTNADGDAPDTDDNADGGAGNGLADDDGDGIPNYLDASNGTGGGTDIAACGDSDYDGLSDCEECPDGIICPDSDGDGQPDYMDTDSDNDGIDDIAECPTGFPCTDTDNDGIADNIESNTQDTDGDGNPDFDDTNADGDAPDTDDNADGGASNGLADDDGDGIPNYLDASNGTGGGTDIAACGDSDYDGLSDCEECPDGIICPDSDGDGQPDYMDTDSDNDGIDDIAECPTGFPCTDTDNDGIADNIESNTQDTDGDGDPDYNDTNADGDLPDTDDNDDGGAGNGLADIDNDGIPNYLDASTGAGDGTDIAACGDSDNDGLSDCEECPGGVQCPDSDGNGQPDYMQARISVSPKIMLGGAYDQLTGLMRDDLRLLNQIPLAQPYDEWTDFNYNGLETTTTNVLNVNGNNAIVDWIMVELRDETDPAVVRARRAALLQRDGDVVDTDGVSSVYFTNASPGNYYVSVRHRNHFGCMTENAIAIGTTHTPLDFTTPLTTTYQLAGATGSTHARQTSMDGKMVLWAGNYSAANGSGNQIIFQGVNSDTDAVFFKVLDDPNNTNFFPLYIVTPTYSREDGDMNGQVIFQGAGADQDVVFFSTALFPENADNTPIYILYEQLPD